METSLTSRSGRRLGTPTVALLTASFVVALTRFSSLAFLTVYLTARTNLSLAQVGFVVGLGPLASFVLSLPGGALADRLGVRRVLLVALSLAAPCLVGYAFVSSFGALCAVALVAGLAWSLFNTTQRVLLSEYAPEAQLERVYGLNYWTNNLGAVVGPALGLWLGGGQSPLPFVLFATVLLGVVALLATTLGQRAKSDVPSVPTAKPAMCRTWAALGGLLLASFFLFLAEAQLETSVSQYLTRSFADGTARFAQLLTAMAVGVVALQPVLSRWSAQANVSLKVFIGTASLAAAPLVFLASDARLVWWLGAAVWVCGELLLGPLIQATVARRGRNARATAFALLGMSGNAAYFVGPWAGGATLEHFGAPQVFVGMTVAALLSGACLLASRPAST